jgi:hypothetical protein
VTAEDKEDLAGRGLRRVSSNIGKVLRRTATEENSRKRRCLLPLKKSRK